MGATFPVPPQPTSTVELVLPAPLPTPGGPVTAYPSLNGITDLVFAPDGSLWASTYEGLVRWNLTGDTYQTINQVDGLPAPGALSLAFAPDGSLWIGTQSGVAQFDGVTWTTHPLASGQGDDLVYDVAIATDGMVWAGTSNGASAFDGHAWRHYSTADGLADNLVWQVAPASNGTVWFSTHAGGLSHFDPSTGKWTTYTAPDSLPIPNARMLAIGPDGQPWVHIGYDDVYRFDGRDWVLAYPTGGQWVCDMAFAADGTPWIATCGGFHSHGSGLVHQVGDQWRTMFAFGDDSWQAAGGGLASFDGQTWRYITSTGGLPAADNVRVLQVAPDGSLWAGGGCGLGRLHEGVWEDLALCDQVDGNIRHLAFAPDRAVWLATEWSVFRMNGQELTRYEQQLPMAIAVDADGTVWVSHNPISGAGWLSAFDGATWHPVTDTLGVGAVTVLVATPDGGVWASGAAGIARLAGPGGPRLYTAVDGLPANGVIDLAVGPDGELWAAGSSAVARLDGDTWSTYELGVPDAQIKALAPGAGKIWLAAYRGVFSVQTPQQGPAKP